jgi:hypothetical protein
MKIEFGPEFEKSLKRLVWRERLAPFNLAEWYRWARDFIQRGHRGYSDGDAWNGFFTIANVAKGAAVHILEHDIGYPMGLSQKRWKVVLSEIVWLMDEVMDDNTPIEVLRSEGYQKRRKQAERWFGKYWQHLWC